MQEIDKKSKKNIGLTHVINKQPYELYLKTIEYKNILQKSKEKKEENNVSNESLNSVPMICPDKLYLIPQEVSTYLFLSILIKKKLNFIYNK